MRRDLAVLEEQGLIHRVHGGAVPAHSLTLSEPAVAERDLTAAPQKDRIARAALDLSPVLPVPTAPAWEAVSSWTAAPPPAGWRPCSPWTGR